MPDEHPQDVPGQPQGAAPTPPQEGSPVPHADPAHIESLQEERLRVAQVATREQYARQCLAVFAPEPQDGTLSYVDVLQRLQTAIVHALEEQQAHG
jgi:hypothetical protein